MRKVGIDLGTTNTVVTIKEDDGIHVIEVDNSVLIPSVFYYNKVRNLRLVGKRARVRGLIHANNYIKSTKRFMDSPQKRFTASGENFSAEDIAVEILLKVKKAIYDYLGHEEDLEAVITVPNNFSTIAVENTKNAGQRAGFHNVTTLKEPIAAVLAYGEAILSQQQGIYFVCDFGGGTLDIAVIKYDGQEYEVIATGGNEKLGGDDFTDAMIEYCYDVILDQHQLDLSQEKIDDNIALQTYYENNENYQRAKARIAEKAEAAKIALSKERQTNIEITELYIRNEKPVLFSHDVTADKFNEYPKTKNLLRHFREAIEDVILKMNQQGIQVNDIDDVILVGGSMNMPSVQAIVKELLPVNILDDHLDTIVAIGASEKIDIKKRIIPKLNYNLGVKIKGDIMSVIIPEQSQYPISKTSTYTTSQDDQIAMDIEVFEGNVIENVYDKENHWLGYLHLSDIEPRPQGEAIIEITFSLNAEGILTITALDTSNNNRVETELNWSELTL